MDFKRIVLLSGHYGSGKTNIAVNLALRMRAAGPRVALADVDIVNPYFRARDSREELEAAGIRVIASEFASSNVDLPALPPEIYAITDDRGLRAVIDVGGDDRGALALGRWRDAIVEENTGTVAEAMQKLNQVDLDSLNSSISSLSAILEPLAAFFGRFG